MSVMATFPDRGQKAHLYGQSQWLTWLDRAVMFHRLDGIAIVGETK